MLEEWRESITGPMSKRGDKTRCNNYRYISLFSITYKLLSNILLSRLSPNTYKFIESH